MKRQPNIIFVVLDTHRLDRLGCYGYPRGTSPNLDSFAQQAVRFENAVAPAQWTIPSHASMFSGEPPATHLTLQSGDVLDARFKTVAEHLRAGGYRTVGFCNNPLVGIINNGFKRGFELFYNYGGAVPSRPAGLSNPVLAPLDELWERYTQFLRQIAYPIQNLFARSTRIFQAALNPLWVPLWTRFANFKGDTRTSIQDTVRFLSEQRPTGGSPYFLFLNLMETHLPFAPPERFVKAFAPRYGEERAARDFMRTFNTQALHWVTALDQPLTALEAQTLSEMYDAEVAYQDHLLAELLAVLERPEHRANSLVVFVADHGEMLGEHQLMGHAFGVYQELIHVPLLIRLPGQTAGRCAPAPVSITRLFHTLLDAAGMEVYPTLYSPAVDIRSQSLLGEMCSGEASHPPVISEAYAPDFSLKVMEKYKPELIDRLNCRATQRAAYEDSYKLIQVEGVHDMLFELGTDRLEQRVLPAEAAPQRRQRLSGQIEASLDKAQSHRPENWRRQQASLDNKLLQQRLRDLGYLE